MTFNFLSGSMPQTMPSQYNGQIPGIGGQMPWSSFAPGEQSGFPGYAQNPLSNQGSNGFSFSDYIHRGLSNYAPGLSQQALGQGLGGLQLMLQGWGSHS